MKTQKIIYWVVTGLLSALVLMSAGMYIFKHGDIEKAFIHLGYPVYIIYPLAIAKILGVVAILSKLSPKLKEWAYVGFFFNFLLAFFAHIVVGDGEFPGALMALIFLAGSYYLDQKVFSALQVQKV